MIIGIGIDLVKIDRIKSAGEKWKARFLDRVFTPAEQSYAASKKSPYPHLAGRFAVKEAVLKALGTGMSGGVSWREISVVSETSGGRKRSGAPRVKVTGRVKRLMDRRGVKEIRISISHDGDYSIAQALLIGSRGR